MMAHREPPIGYLTNRTARLFVRSIDASLRELGVSAGMMPVFIALGGGGALSQKALTEAAAVEQPTMAATLSRMERDGLVERRQDPRDRRVQLFALTPEAAAKAAGVLAAAQAVNAVALGGLDDGERATLIALLSRVAATLEDRLRSRAAGDPGPASPSAPG